MNGGGHNPFKTAILLDYLFIIICYYNVMPKLPSKYTSGLTPQQEKKQLKSIREGKDRPHIPGRRTRRSRYVVAFEKKYGHPITDRRTESIITRKGIEEILRKGRGAYYSSGSRPNVSRAQWAWARLASVIMGGKARDVDKAIWKKYRKKSKRCKKPQSKRR